MAASEFLTEDQIDVISWLSGIVSGFSIVGSSFIVFCYLRFKHLRKFAFKLVSCSSTGRRSRATVAAVVAAAVAAVVIHEN